MIEISSITKSFSARIAVDRLSFEVNDGELFVFLGPNGAGKTTTIKMIAGLLNADSGDIKISGMDIKKDYLDIKRMLGYIPDEPFLYEKLTGNEFLDFIVEMYGFKEDEIAPRREYLTDLFELKAFADRLIESYSHGMRQRLVFVSAFIHNPKLVVIDEPMVGLDPYSIRVVKNLLREEVEKGTTVFMSTHALSVAEELADRVLIIHEGRKRCCDAIDTLKKDHGRSFENVFLAFTGRKSLEDE